MRVTVVTLLGLVAWTAVARADQIGVVVTGDAAMQPKVALQIERWLDDHGHRLVASGLSADAVTTMVNCFVIDDQKCARGVFEARAKARTVIYAHVDVGSKGDRNIVFTAYWFVKGHEAISERRVCESCTEDAWHATTDGMMAALASAIQTSVGHVKITSHPSGLLIFIDSVETGLTPLERDLPVGAHRIDLMQGGRRVGSREIDLDRNETQEVAIKAKLDEGRGGSSRIGPALLLGAGIAALGTGGVFLYYGSLTGSSQKFVYPDSTPIGIGIIAVGVGATIGGAILLAQSGTPRSAPVAAIGPGGGYVGWVTRF